MTEPELRRDPVSGRWVIIATERSKRPDDFRPAPASRSGPGPGFCPFCEGSEAKTPPEVVALRPGGAGRDEPGWRVRVVPNKFPALKRGALPVIRGTGLFQALDGIGVHEVVIESPAHDRDLGDLSLDHVREVVGVYRDRARSIAAEPQYRYVQIFKNKGPEAGATLSHPHTQILATPIVPKRVREEVESGERSWRADGRCLYCRIIGEEETAAERVVRGSGPFMAFVPFAARFPFETHIYPKRHAPSFAGIDDRELDGLAEILRDVLGRLKTVLSDPPYNLVVHQAPHPDSTRVEWPEIESFYHWHIEILPVLTKIAGFEWGTGFHINPISPELAARFLREA